MSVSDRIDSIVTNRILESLIFVLVMWGVYYVSVTTLGQVSRLTGPMTPLLPLSRDGPEGCLKRPVHRY